MRYKNNEVIKCFHCRKKLSVVFLVCRCKNCFCSDCRDPNRHDCPLVKKPNEIKEEGDRVENYNKPNTN